MDDVNMIEIDTEKIQIEVTSSRTIKKINVETSDLNPSVMCTSKSKNN